MDSTFQLGLELTNLFPLKEAVVVGGTALVDFARSLRKSRSDIVVEADLAKIFGRARVRHELETQFKERVKHASFTVLTPGSEVELKSGPGPTLNYSFSNTAAMSTVIQLSFLAYFSERDSLADLISSSINQRVELGIDDHRDDPGAPGISSTLSAMSAQTAAFPWSELVNRVNLDLLATVHNYRFSSDFLKVTSSVLRAGMDFFCLVQSLKESRRVVIDNNMGCISVIIWAHYILGLGVAVVSSLDHKTMYQTSGRISVTIFWPVSPPHLDFRFHGPSPSNDEPTVRLYNEDDIRLVEVGPDLERRIEACALDRHPLRGWATELLFRWLNTRLLTQEDDPVFLATAHLSCALSFHVSHGLFNPRQIQLQEAHSDEELEPYLEHWRIMRAAEMLFAGLSLDWHAVKAQLGRMDKLDVAHVPGAFVKLIDRAETRARMQRDRLFAQFLDSVCHLAATIVLFSHIGDLEKCSELPLRLQNTISFAEDVKNLCRGQSFRIIVEPATMFRGICDLLTGGNQHDELIHPNYTTCAGLLYLFSDFDWSVMLPVVGDADPADVNINVVNVQRGTPTNLRSREQRSRLVDGSAFAKILHPDSHPTRRPKVLLPRPTADSCDRRELWSSRPREFEMTLLFDITPSREWKAQMGSKIVEKFEEVGGYRMLYECLAVACETPLTACTRDHDQRTSMKFAPEAAEVMGYWSGVEWHPDDEEEDLYDKVIVFLTGGQRRLRWLALQANYQGLAFQLARKTLLRTADCCEECAVNYACSLEGRWVVIL